MKYCIQNRSCTICLPLVAATLALAVTVDVQGQDHEPAVPLYNNLGDYHHAISSEVPLVQQYFDQGIRLYYAFNHAEAIRAFNEAARRDPNCAICYWGTALAYGPNINLPMDSASGAAAYAAVRKAEAAAEYADPEEKALISALSTRYVPVPTGDRAPLDTAYAKAMKDVADAFSDDPDATTLYAEAMMDLSPWNYWNKDGSPRPDTPEILTQLEKVIAAHPHHPGSNHFYIHAVEAVDPERALSAAQHLAGLMPGAGHLVHMPGHIYVRVGRYLDAIKANEHAIHADETYIADQNPAFGVYVAGYYPHNYDFLSFAASMIGRSEQAIDASERMVTLVPQDLLHAPGMDFLQHHQTRHLQYKVRFGRWDDILMSSAPSEDLPHAAAMWHYAHGRALAAQGDLEGAEKDLAAVRATAINPEVMDIQLEYNTSGRILAIAAEVLAGEIAAAKKDYPNAIEHLRQGAQLEDDLVYGEPPDWSVPVREELGLVQLAAGKSADAEETFKDDLKRFPDNGWSLHGLADALRAQDRGVEADSVMQQFAEVWATADVEPPRANP